MTTSERRLLAAARAGDEHAYARLVAPHRRALHSHCRRILGSPQDAEDAVQETLLRAWRGLPRFLHRSSLRGWLYAIATNCALTMLDRRRDVLRPAEALDRAVPDARFDQRSDVESALLVAHEQLPPRQRAVLILREALDFSAREVADSLHTSTASVNSALQRARATLSVCGGDAPPRTGSADVRRVRQCAEAWTRADIPGVVALLAGEV